MWLLEKNTSSPKNFSPKPKIKKIIAGQKSELMAALAKILLRISEVWYVLQIEISCWSTACRLKFCSTATIVVESKEGPGLKGGGRDGVSQDGHGRLTRLLVRRSSYGPASTVAGRTLQVSSGLVQPCAALCRDATAVSNRPAARGLQA